MGMGRWFRPPESTKQPAPGEPQTAAKLRILLVDEDSDDLDYYRAFLEEQGYAVRVSDSYKGAARCLEYESFDLILVGQGASAFEGRLVVERALICLDMESYLEAM
jgi:PleD family two-component response regulator